MEFRPLDITVISADDIKNVNRFSTMDVYVLVSIAGDHNAKRKTHVDRNGGTKPKWNHRMNFCFQESTLPQQSILFQLKSDRTLGDKEIGEVSVPIRDLLDNAAASSGDKASERVVDYQIRTASGKSKGSIKFSYKFGEKFTQQVQAVAPKAKHFDEPVTAYPPPPAGASMAYPPPPPGMGYAIPHPGMAAPHYPPGVAYPPQGYGGYPMPLYGGGYPPTGTVPGYGYPSQPTGYGYPPSVQQGQNKKKMGGGGLGLGLGAGLLGGLLVGDMLSDVGDMAAYDAGYDAGFDDGGDFEF